jgi:hypothetical protein
MAALRSAARRAYRRAAAAATSSSSSSTPDGGAAAEAWYPGQLRSKALQESRGRKERARERKQAAAAAAALKEAAESVTGMRAASRAARTPASVCVCVCPSAPTLAYSPAVSSSRLLVRRAANRQQGATASSPPSSGRWAPGLWLMHAGWCAPGRWHDAHDVGCHNAAAGAARAGSGACGAALPDALGRRTAGGHLRAAGTPCGAPGSPGSPDVHPAHQGGGGGPKGLRASPSPPVAIVLVNLAGAQTLAGRSFEGLAKAARRSGRLR